MLAHKLSLKPAGLRKFILFAKEVTYYSVPSYLETWQ